MATVPGSSTGVVKTAHRMVLVAAPSSGYRVVASGWIQNRDTAVTVTVRLFYKRSNFEAKRDIIIGPSATWETSDRMVFAAGESLEAQVVSGSPTEQIHHDFSYLDQT